MQPRKTVGSTGVVVALAGLLCLVMGQTAGAEDAEFERRLEAAEKRIAELESSNAKLRAERNAQDDENWISERRSEHVRALIEEVIADADARGASLDGKASDDPAEGGDNTGTDPRDFGNKFMPYFRYLELDGGVKVRSLAVFGLFAFDPRLAMTYELPVAQEIDYSDAGPFKAGMGLPPGSGDPGGSPGSGVPFADLDADGDVVGMGDLILRMFSRPRSLEWVLDDGSGNALGKVKSFSIMPTFELTAPTATEEAIGGEALIFSPAVTFVMDIPGDAPFGLGFIAMMNFVDFDVFKDEDRGSTTRYRGRIFWMQPLSPPGPELFDGIYVLVELQPIYDFMEDEFSFWFGPEFGKVVNEGFIVYGKPGWGVSPDPGEREFTFEAGMRIFY